MKRITLASVLTVLILCIALPVNVFSINNADEVKVLVNGEYLNFDVEPAIISGRAVVPLRAIFEALDAEVKWYDRTKTVIATRQDVRIILAIGNKTAYVNKKKVELDVPAYIIDGRTLVPVRFISESLGAVVNWDETTRTVIIEMGNGQSLTVTPTSTATPTSASTPTSANTPTSTPTPTSTKTSAPVEPQTDKEFNFSGNIDELMGQSNTSIISEFGQPNRVDLSKYGFDWYIYNSDYNKYIQIGIKEGSVVGVYTNTMYYKAFDNIKVQSSKSSVDNLLGTPLTYIQKGRVRYRINDSGEQNVFDVDEKYFATVFYDIHDGNKVSAMLLIDREVEMSLAGYYGEPSEKLRQSYDRQIFDLANAVRVRLGKEPYKWDDKVSEVARKHSEDMALNNYFSHTNLEGKSPFARMTDAGIKFSMASENIAKGQMSGIYAHEAWMNSSGHRSNILGKCENLGVGVYIGSDNDIYYTQNFYTPR